MSYDTQRDIVDPLEDAASLAAGLDLAPWVAARAAVEREIHLEQRRGESEETTRSKAWQWERGTTNPQGGRSPGSTVRYLEGPETGDWGGEGVGTPENTNGR